MWFIFIVLAIAYATKPYETAIFRSDLRNIPEKLKQERIQETIQNTYTLVKGEIMRAATRNETETNFTLFCKEPNSMSHMFRKKGSTYHLLDTDDADYAYLSRYGSYSGPQPIMKSKCSIKDGYELYNRFYDYPNYDKSHPYYVPLDFTARSKPGIFRQNLEQDPILYIQKFFQLLNYEFPDVSLTISHERKGEGIFETDCCPVYIVSW
jgi:hypothetical protein